MLSDNRILIIGGDKRQSHLCDVLLARGYVCLYENNDIKRVMSKIRECKYIVLPVPVSRNGKQIYSDNSKFRLDTERLVSSLTNRHIVFGAGFDKATASLLEEKNIVFADMNSNEDFLLYNAFLTAQGAVCLLLNSTEKFISGSRVLITGYGRIGKALTHFVKGLGAEVTVCARNESQLTGAKGIGCKGISIKDMPKTVHIYDYIFNTVPDNIFSFSDIALMDNSCIYFELASKPFGAAERIFEELDKKYVSGASLPGRFLSQSAGERIASFIEKMV